METQSDTPIMARLQALEEQVAALDRLRRKETVHRLWTGMAALVLGLTGATALRVGAQTGTPKVAQSLVCKELKIVNDTGKTQVKVGLSTSNQGQIIIYGTEGNNRAIIGLTTDGLDGFVGTYGQEGKPRVSVSASAKDDSGSVAVYDGTGKFVRDLQIAP